MKTLFFFLSVLLIPFSCKKKEKIIIDVPWLISLNDSEALTYNARDTLKKYNEVDEDIIINKSQFFSFKANLNSMINDSLATYKYLKMAVEIDSLKMCENVMIPIHNYFYQERPDREKSIPSILNYQLDYIIDLLKRCEIEIPESKGIKPKNRRYFYWLKYVMTRDQWYRVPQREENWEAQSKLDLENQIFIDELFVNTQYPQEEYFKQALQVLLLHSDNSKWTYKWLKRYFQIYENGNEHLPFIKHFEWRSSVVNDPKIQNLIMDYKNLY